MAYNTKEQRKMAFEQGIKLSKFGAIFNSILSTVSFLGLSTIAGWLFLCSMLFCLLGWWFNVEGLKLMDKLK